MAVTLVNGDMFELEKKGVAITIPVNTVGVMGKGVALRFKKEHPLLFKTYRKMCLSGGMKVGHPVVFVDDRGTYILFPTKKDWRKPSELQWIDAGLKYIRENLSMLKQIAMPALGCGNGNLSWDSVKELVYSVFGKDNDFLILLYKPHVKQTAKAGV